MKLLFDPARHEALADIAWDEARVRDFIAHIVSGTEAAYSPKGWWPQHPLDGDPAEDLSQAVPALYHGACGVCWALHYLQDVGAAKLQRNYLGRTAELLARTDAWLGDEAPRQRASFLMGHTPIHLLACSADVDAATADLLAGLIAGHLEHPARELMWGSPGSLLAALFLHERTGDARWAVLFRATAARLWAQRLWSDEFGCHYWEQEMFGRRSTYLDAVHGFVATALPLIRGRALLDAADWAAWQTCIETTVARTATREGGLVNWRAWLVAPPGKGLLMQYCHGAPGFVVCLAGLPGQALDELLLAAGETTWAAGPLRKGANLCHGTGGNGYAFLKLYQRTGDAMWLQRARAFAMHGIAQTQAHERQHGQLRHSLWTGDPGFAIYLWDCLQAQARFPTLDMYYGGGAAA